MYTVETDGQTQVFCDMTLNVNGKRGWLVIQRRVDDQPPFFNATRAEYEFGFGRLDSGNLWLGLDKIKGIIDRASNGVELYIGMGDHSTPQRTVYALWNSFSIGTAANDWTLSISTATTAPGFTSSTSPGLANSMAAADGKKFSTFDDDMDGEARNCAEDFGGGWWFTGPGCLEANMNGVYYPTPSNAAGGLLTGIVYQGWLGNNYSLKEVVMAIRPK